jgi:hypothetical protein
MGWFPPTLFRHAGVRGQESMEKLHLESKCRVAEYISVKGYCVFPSQTKVHPTL